MRVQDIIDKITDETKVDDLLIDLSELAEEENKHETKISELENIIKEKDERIRDLKVDNHELLKKVANSVDFYRDKNDDDDNVEIKSEDEILKSFLDR
jgi:predicted  nucleic acid-binding Zn-ribbon protein